MIAKDENNENMPHLEITEAEVVLVHCNIASNGHQHDSSVFYTFLLSKWFVKLFDISPKNFMFL